MLERVLPDWFFQVVFQLDTYTYARASRGPFGRRKQRVMETNVVPRCLCRRAITSCAPGKRFVRTGDLYTQNNLCRFAGKRSEKESRKTRVTVVAYISQIGAVRAYDDDDCRDDNCL